MEVSLIGESLKFMALGMTIVFLFLFILVQVIKLQAKIIGKYFPEKEVATVSKTAPSAADDSAKTAAIIAAITEFKKNKS